MIEPFLNPPDPQVAIYLFILLPFLFVENIFFQKHDFFVEAPKDPKIKVAIFQSFETITQ